MTDYRGPGQHVVSTAMIPPPRSEPPSPPPPPGGLTSPLWERLTSERAILVRAIKAHLKERQKIIDRCEQAHREQQNYGEDMQEQLAVDILAILGEERDW